MSARDLRWLTPEIEEAQAYHRRRVEALYAGQPPGDVIAIAGGIFGRSHPLLGSNETDMLTHPRRWLDEVLNDMAQHAAQAADRVTFRPLVVELDPLGVHYIDAVLGARTTFHEGQVWAEQLDGDPGDLAMPDLAGCEVFQESLALARLSVEAGQGRLLIATPVFSCPINVGVNLFGQRLLEALVDRVEAARRALRTIADVIIACARAFAEAIPQAVRRNSVAETRYAPPGFGQIDGCATQLVSAGHYREVLAPLDEEILGVSPQGGMIHLCGSHAQHIGAWRGVRALRSVQLNDRATEDLEVFWRGLRADQILYVAPTEAMPVSRILEITGGRRLVLQCALEEPIPL